MRILLVEDDASIAAVVKRGLEESRFSVDVASDGESGLRQALTGARLLYGFHQVGGTLAGTEATPENGGGES